MRRTNSPDGQLTKDVWLLMPHDARVTVRGRASCHASRSSSTAASLSGQAKRPQRLRVEVVFDPGPDLFSQGPTSQVSSALVGLTAVFGMGTGVTPPLQGPRHELYQLGPIDGKAEPIDHVADLARRTLGGRPGARPPGLDDAVATRATGRG